MGNLGLTFQDFPQKLHRPCCNSLKSSMIPKFVSEMAIFGGTFCSHQTRQSVSCFMETFYEIDITRSISNRSPIWAETNSTQLLSKIAHFLGDVIAWMDENSLVCGQNYLEMCLFAVQWTGLINSLNFLGEVQFM
jgi:hypothetical protein